MKKDTSKLVRKVITNTKGKKQTVWVKQSGEETKVSFSVTGSNGEKYNAVKTKFKNKYIAFNEEGNRVADGLN